MTRRITRSHPDFGKINFLTTLLHILKNRHMHRLKEHPLFDLPPPGEEKGAADRIEKELGELLEGGPFRDCIVLMDIENEEV